MEDNCRVDSNMATFDAALDAQRVYEAEDVESRAALEGSLRAATSATSHGALDESFENTAATINVPVEARSPYEPGTAEVTAAQAQLLDIDYGLEDSYAKLLNSSLDWEDIDQFFEGTEFREKRSQ